MPAINPRGRGRRTISEINMVPFIDVMLVLLIIFMVTAPLITPSMIAVPSVGNKTKLPKQPANPLLIQIHKDESIDIKRSAKADAVPSSAGSIAADLVKIEPLVQAEGAQAVPVVISADKSIQYETVVKVMATLREAGVSRVGLSVQKD